MKRLLSSFFLFAFIFCSFNATSQVLNYTTQQAPLPCLNKEFSVVVHIVLDSLGEDGIADRAQIDDAFEALNEAYEPICAKFKVCETREIRNFQFNNIDTLEKWEDLIVKENQPNRINVYLVDFSVLAGFDGGAPQFECGYANLNGIDSVSNSTILWHKACLGTTQPLIHLFGHYFGLLHTFEGNGTELVDGSNCDTEGDLICDTPADNYNPPVDPIGGGFINSEDECRFIHPDSDPNGDPYRAHTGNFMSYYGLCRCGFTYQQYLNMANNYLATDPRAW